MRLFVTLFNTTPDSVAARATLTALRAAARLGLTSLQDMAMQAGPAQTLRAFRAAAGVGPGPRVRVIPMPIPGAVGLDAAAWAAAVPEAALDPAGAVRVAGLKYVLDGTPLERNALMRRAYADRAGWYGRADFPPDTLRAWLRAALAAAPGAAHQLMLHAAGIPLALGSDGLVNPFLNLLFATTDPADPRKVLTREQAVTAYTRGSAYAEFAEREKGTLAPGMLADLAVLSHDIFTVPAPALPATTSVLTRVGGRAVFDAGVLAPSAPGVARPPRP